MTTQLAILDPKDIPAEAEIRFARMKASGVLPPHITNVIVMQFILSTGVDYGLNPAMSISELNIINGRVGMSAKCMMYLALKSPSCDYIMPVELSSTKAVYEGKHVKSPRPTTLVYTIEQAKAAGLLNGNPRSIWSKDPAAMLSARCTARIIRAVLPDSIVGTTYELDELRHIEPLTVPVTPIKPSPRQVANDPLATEPPESSPQVVAGPDPLWDKPFINELELASTPAEVRAIEERIKVVIDRYSLSRDDEAVGRLREAAHASRKKVAA